MSLVVGVYFLSSVSCTVVYSVTKSMDVCCKNSPIYSNMQYEVSVISSKFRANVFWYNI